MSRKQGKGARSLKESPQVMKKKKSPQKRQALSRKSQTSQETTTSEIQKRSPKARNSKGKKASPGSRKAILDGDKSSPEKRKPLLRKNQNAAAKSTTTPPESRKASRRYPQKSPAREKSSCRNDSVESRKPSVRNKKSSPKSKTSPSKSKKSPTRGKKSPSRSKKSPLKSKKSPPKSKKSPLKSKKSSPKSEKSNPKSKKQPRSKKPPTRNKKSPLKSEKSYPQRPKSNPKTPEGRRESPKGRKAFKNKRPSQKSPKSSVPSKKPSRQNVAADNRNSSPPGKQTSTVDSRNSILENQKLSSKSQKLSSRSRNLSPRSQKISSKSQKLSSKSQKLTPGIQKLSSKSQKLSSKSQKLSSKSQKLSSKSQKLSSLTQKTFEKSQQQQQQQQKSPHASQRPPYVSCGPCRRSPPSSQLESVRERSPKTSGKIVTQKKSNRPSIKSQIGKVEDRPVEKISKLLQPKVVKTSEEDILRSTASKSSISSDGPTKKRRRRGTVSKEVLKLIKEGRYNPRISNTEPKRTSSPKLLDIKFKQAGSFLSTSSSKKVHALKGIRMAKSRSSGPQLQMKFPIMAKNPPLKRPKSVTTKSAALAPNATSPQQELVRKSGKAGQPAKLSAMATKTQMSPKSILKSFPCGVFKFPRSSPQPGKSQKAELIPTQQGGQIAASKFGKIYGLPFDTQTAEGKRQNVVKFGRPLFYDRDDTQRSQDLSTTDDIGFPHHDIMGFEQFLQMLLSRTPGDNQQRFKTNNNNFHPDAFLRELLHPGKSSKHPGSKLYAWKGPSSLQKTPKASIKQLEAPKSAQPKYEGAETTQKKQSTTYPKTRGTPVHPKTPNVSPARQKASHAATAPVKRSSIPLADVRTPQVNLPQPKTSPPTTKGATPPHLKTPNVSPASNKTTPPRSKTSPKVSTAKFIQASLKPKATVDVKAEARKTGNIMLKTPQMSTKQTVSAVMQKSAAPLQKVSPKVPADDDSSPLIIKKTKNTFSIENIVRGPLPTKDRLNPPSKSSRGNWKEPSLFVFGDPKTGKSLMKKSCCKSLSSKCSSKR